MRTPPINNDRRTYYEIALPYAGGVLLLALRECILIYWLECNQRIPSEVSEALDVIHTTAHGTALQRLVAMADSISRLPLFGAAQHPVEIARWADDGGRV